MWNADRRITHEEQTSAVPPHRWAIRLRRSPVPERCGRSEHRLGSLYKFMARTGLRRGEALGLCRDDVENDAGYLVVHTALVQVGSGVVEGGAKTEAGESRRDALASDTLGLLMTQRLTQEADQVGWGSAYRRCGHGVRVSAREDGSDLTSEQVTKTFARLVKAAGVRPQRLRDLRHLSASFDALAGVPINVTSKRLGHSTRPLRCGCISTSTRRLPPRLPRRQRRSSRPARPLSADSIRPHCAHGTKEQFGVAPREHRIGR